MASIGNIVAGAVFETSGFEQGVKRGIGAVSKFEAETIKRLKNAEKAAASIKLDKALGLGGSGGEGNSIERILKLGALNKIGSEFEKLSVVIAKFRADGVSSFKDMATEMARDIPVLGQFVRAFDNIYNAKALAEMKMEEESKKRSDDAAAQQAKIKMQFIDQIAKASEDTDKQIIEARQQAEIAAIQDETDRSVRAAEIERDNKVKALEAQYEAAIKVKGAGILTKAQSDAIYMEQMKLYEKIQAAKVAAEEEGNQKIADIYDKRDKDAAEKAKKEAEDKAKSEIDTLLQARDRVKGKIKDLESKANKPFEMTTTENSVFKSTATAFVAPSVFRPVTAEIDKSNEILTRIETALLNAGYKDKIDVVISGF